MISLFLVLSHQQYDSVISQELQSQPGTPKTLDPPKPKNINKGENNNGRMRQKKKQKKKNSLAVTIVLRVYFHKQTGASERNDMFYILFRERQNKELFVRK